MFSSNILPTDKRFSFISACMTSSGRNGIAKEISFYQFRFTFQFAPISFSAIVESCLYYSRNNEFLLLLFRVRNVPTLKRFLPLYQIHLPLTVHRISKAYQSCKMLLVAQWKMNTIKREIILSL